MIVIMPVRMPKAILDNWLPVAGVPTCRDWLPVCDLFLNLQKE